MEYWFNRPESAQDADLEEVTRHELYGYDSCPPGSDLFLDDEYDNSWPAPRGSLATPQEVETGAIDQEDVRELRDWSEENQL